MNNAMAYKVVSYIVEDEPSLNMVDDEWFDVDLRYLDSDGKGFLIIEKSKIKKAIKKAERDPDPEDREMYLKTLNKLLQDCGNKDYCVYWCK